MKKLSLILKIFAITIFCFLTVAVITYTTLLPLCVNNQNIVSFVKYFVSKNLNIQMIVKEPYLETGLSDNVTFKVDSINISKENELLFSIQNFYTKFSIKKILEKKIVIEDIRAKSVFADVNKLIELTGKKQEQKQKGNPWSLDLYDAIMFLEDSFITYKTDPDTTIKLRAYNLFVDNSIKTQRLVHFNFEGQIIKNGKIVDVSFSDNNKFIIGNKKLVVLGCPLSVNRSEMFFNAEASREKGYRFETYANRFFLPDILKLLDTQVIPNNISETLSPLKRINGDISFNIILTKNDIKGTIKLNRLSFEIAQLFNMPVSINSGTINLTKDKLTLEEFSGFYAGKKVNDFKFKGIIKDYLKTPTGEIIALASMTNDLVGKYITQATGTKLTLKEKTKAIVKIGLLPDQLDIEVAGKIQKGNDILIENISITPEDQDRALKAVSHLKGDIFDIETINYYVAPEITRASKGKIKPILTMGGQFQITTGKILKLSLNTPSPIPSEFLNIITKQKTFKHGTFQGQLDYLNETNIPKFSGNIKINKVAIPPQRLFLREATLTTDNNLIKIKANGKYRRNNYDFYGEISNKIIFPIVVKNTRLTIDDIDIEKILQVFTSSQQTEEEKVAAYDKTTEQNQTSANDTKQTFDIRNLIVEECDINILKGKYKKIDFGNLKTTISLDKNGILKLKSNRFDIANGYSSADIFCDIVKQQYEIKLGVKNVDSDVMASSILNLEKEISGRASGIMKLSTNQDLKLNGDIRFSIKDGQIPKIGLIEYVLKFAALFRNPIVMISPSVFSDLVNVSEGTFEKITGELHIKDNRIELMKIKSSSPQLSSYIVGCYDIEKSDAILKLYMKFSNKNKGVAGFLRNISLNSIANRMKIAEKNEVNYYSSELAQIPDIDADEKDYQIFLTKIDGDIEHNNFISILKKIK